MIFQTREELTNFFPMHSFSTPPENIRKPWGFRCLQGGQRKGALGANPLTALLKIMSKIILPKQVTINRKYLQCSEILPYL